VAPAVPVGYVVNVVDFDAIDRLEIDIAFAVAVAIAVAASTLGSVERPTVVVHCDLPVIAIDLAMAMAVVANSIATVVVIAVAVDSAEHLAFAIEMVMAIAVDLIDQFVVGLVVVGNSVAVVAIEYFVV